MTVALNIFIRNRDESRENLIGGLNLDQFAGCLLWKPKNVVNHEQRFDVNQRITLVMPKDDKILDAIILNPLQSPHLNVWNFNVNRTNYCK